MKSLILLTLVILPGATAIAQSRPIILHEEQTLPSPVEGCCYWFVNSVALDGDRLVATGIRPAQPPDILEDEISAFWWQRDAVGRWQFRGRILYDNELGDRQAFWPTVAARDGVIAIQHFPLTILERTATGWSTSTVDAGSGFQIDTDDGAIATIDAQCGRYVQKTGGAWIVTAPFVVPGDPACSTSQRIALREDAAMLSFIHSDQTVEARVFRRPAAGGAWRHVGTLFKPDYEDQYQYGWAQAFTRPLALITGRGKFGTHVFRNFGNNSWAHDGNLRSSADAAKLRSARIVHIEGNLVVQADDSPYVNVFRARPDRTFEHVAILWPRDTSYALGQPISIVIRGRRVAVSHGEVMYFYELPATFEQAPPLVHEDFASGSAPGWQPTPGSGFATIGGDVSRVYRQSQITGNAQSVYTPISWTNQAVETDIRPIEFSGADRWVGLMTRRTDANNYYYVTLRSSNRVQLKRMQGGLFSTLAETPDIIVTPGQTYRLRLESIGTRHRVYLDGRMITEAYDLALTTGSAGLATFRARADFDNVTLSTQPQTELINITTMRGENFSFSGVGSWAYADFGTGLVQSSNSGIARAFVPNEVADQTVAARFRHDMVPGADPVWVGLITRYVDDSNYYYLTMRATGEVQIRKAVSGQVQVLASRMRPYAQHVRLRLEAIGPRLRAYVNGRLIVSATDTSFERGGSGVATFGTSAQISEVLAYEP